jgi:hypothetical protein
VSQRGEPTGHVFISYVRENWRDVDWLQQRLESAGIRVWRDTADLWPGEEWRARIRHAITDNSLVFVACFSRESVAREKSYQNEELILAVEEMRLRSPDVPWLIPVRLDDCEIPDRSIGGGRTLSSIQRVDMFGAGADDAAMRLVATVLRLLGRDSGPTRSAGTQTHAGSRWSADSPRPEAKRPPPVAGPTPPWQKVSASRARSSAPNFVPPPHVVPPPREVKVAPRPRDLSSPRPRRAAISAGAILAAAVVLALTIGWIWGMAVLIEKQVAAGGAHSAAPYGLFALLLGIAGIPILGMIGLTVVGQFKRGS